MVDVHLVTYAGRVCFQGLLYNFKSLGVRISAVRPTRSTVPEAA